ncbi:MAG: hypothetical protein R3279_11740, partial [Putridiphycobacter sp.]|nr:hypothetical protein [Putridiphycobacter sp.]
MDNYKIRQDRPRMSSEEIAQRKDFDSILNDHHIMKKPFFKNPWFFGVTGMASVGLLIGTSYGFTDRRAEPPEVATVTEHMPPPTIQNKTIQLASFEPKTIENTESNEKIIPITSQKKNEIHDNTSTLEKKSIDNNNSATETPSKTEMMPDPKSEVLEASVAFQNHPKINGKIGGALSAGSLSNQTTILTDSNIPIIGFEMSVETEFGAKIYSAESNTLTAEMIKAIKA